MWVYEEYKKRMNVELGEALFLPEVKGFFFSSHLILAQNINADINDLKFSRIIDGVEEEYSPKKDDNIIYGADVYYPDDNCFCLYFNEEVKEERWIKQKF